MNWKWSESKTQNYFLFHWTGNRFSKQNKTFLSWNENKNKSEIKAEVKLICSRPGTAIQNKKKVKLICSWPRTTIQNRKSKINMFMARNCRSLCRYASRLDERLLYSGSKLMDELNRKRAWVLSATALEFRDWVWLLLTTECWRLSPL